MKFRTALLVVLSLLLVGVAPPTVASAAPSDADGNWFEVDAPPTDMPCELIPQVTKFRTALFNAETAMQAVVDLDSLALAVPGDRVIVPKAGDLTLTLFDGEKFEVTIAEVALTIFPGDSTPSVEAFGHAVSDSEVGISAIFSFLPDERGNYIMMGTLDSVRNEQITITQVNADSVTIQAVDPSLFEPTTDIVVEPDENDPEPPAAVPPTPTIRLAGANRHETAVEVSKHAFPHPQFVDTVVVATDADFADALSAAPLAAKLDGPLLLTSVATLPSATAAEISRLNPSKIVVVGSTGAVSADVFNALQELTAPDGTITRIDGVDRYATSQAIARYGWCANSTTNAFIATGTNFPDALSADAAAVWMHAPLILVRGTDSSAPVSVQNFLTGAGVNKIYIAGGTAIVSTGIENSVKTGRSVKRYAGGDRYDTSALIALDHSARGGRVYLAYGGDYPDALAGSVAAGRAYAPVLLSRQNCVPAVIDRAQKNLAQTQRILLGGPGVLSDAVRLGTVC